MTNVGIAYVLEAAQWSLVGVLIGLPLRTVFHRHGHYHRRTSRREH